MDKQYSIIVIDKLGEMKMLQHPEGSKTEEVMMKTKEEACSFYDKMKQLYQECSVKMIAR
ncbi:hypothetical protein [Alkalicoccus chagannorensis]|uniref:hypothetical protein n=1 Tax=Alkalicoccus chagannorensis TaxID=427072 RepID=UPI000421F168|nr:hypothetical protein [Alkalicoccus chagannorensis]